MGALTNGGAEWYVNLQTGKRNVDFPHLCTPIPWSQRFFLIFPALESRKATNAGREAARKKNLYSFSPLRGSLTRGKSRKTSGTRVALPRYLHTIP